MEDYDEARRAVAASCARLIPEGLSVGTGGNISVRAGEYIAISPSQLPYAQLQSEHICLVTTEGRRIEGRLAASSELDMHLALYEDLETAAVVHIHSPFATALSTVLDELPAIHYVINQLGGPVPVSPYAPFGSKELAANVSESMLGRNAVLLQNHGATVVGATLAQAFDRALLLEWLCGVYHRAASIGTPRLLTSGELAVVRERSAQQRQRVEEAWSGEAR